jgi:hypothetical protein
LKDVLFVQKEETAESDTFFFDQNTVVASDVLGEIGEDGVLQVSDTALLARSVAPSFVGEDGVNRASNNLAVESFELRNSVREGEDFSGADEGEVKRVKEKKNFLALELRKTNLFEDLALNGIVGLDGEVGSRLTNLGDREGLEAFRSSNETLGEVDTRSDPRRSSRSSDTGVEEAEHFV